MACVPGAPRSGDVRMDETGTPGTACLVGHTGFVGSALLRQSRFDACFNSSNIAEIAGGRFDTLVCAAAPGSMFEANRRPADDRAKVHALMERLADVEVDRFILISSIAVLADFAGGEDEGTQAFQTELAYGRHRRELEAFVEDRFPSHLIVRLPALFGEGLRKNFVFDLLNPVPTMLTPELLDRWTDELGGSLAATLRGLYGPNPDNGMVVLDRAALAVNAHKRTLEQSAIALGYSATRFHNRETTYQYYGIERLWADIGIALGAGLSHIHLVNEPLPAARIHERLTGRAMTETGARPHHEDMHTRHADLWGTNGPYIADAETTLDRLEAFFARQKAPA